MDTEEAEGKLAGNVYESHESHWWSTYRCVFAEGQCAAQSHGCLSVFVRNKKKSK